VGLFIREYSDRTRGNSFTQKEGRFRLDIRNKFCTVGVVRLWPRLPRGAVAAHPWQVGWSSEHPGLVGGVPAYGRGLELDDL